MKNFLAAAVAVVVLGATPAFAHAHLLSQSPSEGVVLSAAPTLLTLKFSESVSLKFTGVKVTGLGDTEVSLGTESLDPADDALLSVPVADVLGPGVYTVAWHALSTDGHKSTGSYSFTVK
jgi:methionine-rich copper-binding protein CopC